MKDLGFLTALASGAIEAEAPMIHAAGVLRCLERQQGTELMLSSVVSALADGARLVGQGPFMVEYLHFAASQLAETLAPPAPRVPGGVPVAQGAGDASLTELIVQACSAYDAMTPEQRAAHDEAQRQSWVRGDLGIDRGTSVIDLAAFRRKEG